MTITIKESKTADSRTCGDPTKVTRKILIQSTLRHQLDVTKGLDFLAIKLATAGLWHDVDKIGNIDQFHSDFQTGFSEQVLWDSHKTCSRHHLLAEEGIPEDVDLIDVLEFIVDCVMAGMARSGSVYDLVLPSELLQKAFRNTVELLKSEVVVEREEGCA